MTRSFTIALYLVSASLVSFECKECSSMKPSAKPDPSAIVEIRHELELVNLNPGDLSKFLTDHVFHHREVDLSNSILNPEEFKIIFNPNVTRFECDISKPSDDFDLTRLLERMPYLEVLNIEVDFEIPNLAATLFNWKQKSKLKKLFVHCHSIDNFFQNPALTANFMKRQRSNFIMEFNYYEFNNLKVSKKFQNHFYKINTFSSKGRILIIGDLLVNSPAVRYFKIKRIL